ncbi:CBS domain-containing protein [Magnetospirillum fulvum]|uniref:CBS domain-containing protein n=1 Tax=Magnetospirillum fulvum MGU-K5 TaxID=1316936 RepID=S9SAL3_MAGFU|nr:CBS domain-containing protein [Magnetospirillum fulvum]EPY02942.1 CBS domain-containing protein [Magnetospirillum fulvum MGU-K5]
MTVRSVLDAKTKGTGEVVSIRPDALVTEAAQLLARHRIGAVPVIEAGHLVGILSERDIVRALAHSPESLGKTRVRALMTPEVFVARETDALDAVLELMSTKRIRHLPVVDRDGVVIGIVTLGDVAWARERELES